MISFTRFIGVLILAVAPAWALAAQKEGNFQIFGPFAGADAAAVLAARLALPASAKSSAWKETFSLFDWMILLSVERERLAALLPEAGGSDALGITPDQISA